MFLRISNPGVTSYKAFTLFGASTTRSSSNAGSIGMFGTGGKQAIALLLRNGIEPIVFCGNLRLSFTTKKEDVNGRHFDQVIVNLSGKDESGTSVKRTEDLGFVTQVGEHDWVSIDMALREFVSNALDGALENEGNWKNAKVEMVEDNQVRAQSGQTRVYIDASNYKVMEFYSQLGKRFLHFAKNENLSNVILEKAGRSTQAIDSATIYKRGVRVRQVNSPERSLFDYNTDVQLDESRNMDDWAVRTAVAQLYRDVEVSDLVKVFIALQGEEKFWEGTLDAYSLTGYQPSEESKERWQKAWRMAAGEKAVMMAATGIGEETIRNKGYKPVRVCSDSWLSAASTMGIKTLGSVLSEDEKLGREILPANDAVKSALDFVWKTAERLKLTNGAEKPSVKCFTEPMKGGAQTHGVYRDGEVLIHTDIASVGIALDKVMWEEVAHHITGAGDASRDLQDWAFRALATVFH